MDFDYNVEKQEITVELNTPRIELDTPSGGRGLKGDKGNPGAKGDPGDPGTPGKDGEAATITVGSTTTGDAGTDASVTNSGTTSAAVLDFTIPKGDKGDTGDTGETGNGISSIEKTSTSGLVDTYTIYFTDGTTTTYTVTNGSGGGGSATDVQINGTSITSGGTANILTEGVYSASTNKIATMSDLSSKQDTLVSGTNIKTINNTSLLGSGNLSLASAWGDITGTLSNQTDLKNALDNKVNTSSLATVATTGDYDDLLDKPTIPTVPTNLSSFTDDLGSSPTHTHSQYLTSYTETDPVFTASAAHGISSTDISNWNAKADMGITEVTGGSIRIWGSETGMYYLPKGTLIYYAGESSMSHYEDDYGDTFLFINKRENGPFYESFWISGFLYHIVTYQNSYGGLYRILNAGDIKNTLTETSSYYVYALDARQGKVLKDLIDAIKDGVSIDSFGDVETVLGNKQDTLVSGTNIKTINSASLLGSGDISVEGIQEITQSGTVNIWQLDEGVYRVPAGKQVSASPGSSSSFSGTTSILIINKASSLTYYAWINGNRSKVGVSDGVTSYSMSELIDSGDVKNNLTTSSSDTGYVLDARQGKVLKDYIGTLSSLTTTDKTDLVSAINEVKKEGNIYKVNEATLSSPFVLDENELGIYEMPRYEIYFKGDSSYNSVCYYNQGVNVINYFKKYSDAENNEVVAFSEGVGSSGWWERFELIKNTASSGGLSKSTTYVTNLVKGVKVNGTSVVSDNIAELITNTAYDSTTNPIATMSDVNDKNIICVGLAANTNVVSNATWTHFSVPIDTQIASVGTKLTFNSTNHRVVVGSGVSYVKMGCFTLLKGIANGIEFNVRKNGTTIGSINVLPSTASVFEAGSLVDILVPVSSGDYFDFTIRTAAKGTITVGGGSTTGITFEVIT